MEVSGGEFVKSCLKDALNALTVITDTLTCTLKWETSRELTNEHEHEKIEYVFRMEHTEEMLEGTEDAKSEILEAVNKASAYARYKK